MNMMSNKHGEFAARLQHTKGLAVNVDAVGCMARGLKGICMIKASIFQRHLCKVSLIIKDIDIMF